MTDDTILIVDDSPFMLRVLTFILKEAGYATVTADSGEEALAKARSSRPRLILLDAVMPDMDGWQVLEAIKKDPSLQKIRVVMVSGLEAGKYPGADGYIQKPFTPDQVQSIVATLLSP